VTFHDKMSRKSRFLQSELDAESETTRNNLHNGEKIMKIGQVSKKLWAFEIDRDKKPIQRKSHLKQLMENPVVLFGNSLARNIYNESKALKFHPAVYNM